jgi:hypothetical protein
MVDLDNRLYAKAAQVDVIVVPPNVAGSAVQGGPQWEFIQTYVQDYQNGGPLQFTGQGSSFLHGLISGQFAYMEFLDLRDNEVKRVYIGDTITVKFSDNSTAQLRLVGVVGGMYFHLVHGSERDANGNPTAPLPPTAATPSGNGGIGLMFVFNHTDYLATELIMNICVSIISYSDNYGSGYIRREYVCPH